MTPLRDVGVPSSYASFLGHTETVLEHDPTTIPEPDRRAGEPSGRVGGGAGLPVTVQRLNVARRRRDPGPFRFAHTTLTGLN